MTSAGTWVPNSGEEGGREAGGGGGTWSWSLWPP